MKKIFSRTADNKLRKENVRRMSERIKLSYAIDEILRPENNMIEGTDMSLDDFMMRLSLKAASK